MYSLGSVGNCLSSLIFSSTQSIRDEIYCGAGRAVGFLYFSPSCQRYSYLAPPDILGQDWAVQASLTVPYNKFIRLKKSTTERAKSEKETGTNYLKANVITPWMATQSFRSSPGGRRTAARRSNPEWRVALSVKEKFTHRSFSPFNQLTCALLWSEWRTVPAGNFFFGLKVWKKNSLNPWGWNWRQSTKPLTSSLSRSRFLTFSRLTWRNSKNEFAITAGFFFYCEMWLVQRKSKTRC